MNSKLQQRSKTKSKGPKVSERISKARLDDKPSDKRVSSPAGLRITSKLDQTRRESIEICEKHGNNIVAYEEKTGRTVCETCVYKDKVDRPIFTASVAKQIDEIFEEQYTEFHKLNDEFMKINKAEIIKRVQDTIADFFDLFRNKINELENKAVAKINQSSSLEILIKNVDDMKEYLNTEKIIEKYDAQRDQIKSKIRDCRYTYICQRRESYDDVTNDLREDNRKMSRCIKNIQEHIDNICNVKMDEIRIENVLSRLASECILIDKKNPNFGEIILNSSAQETEEKILMSQREHSSENTEELLSESMNAYYYSQDNNLWCKEIDGDKVYNEQIMPLKLHFQKVITIPTVSENKVFLLGGAKDDVGKEPIDNCYEVDFTKKMLIPVKKLNEPKLSFAAGISPDCKSIIVAGGSTGSNNPTNSCSIFDVQSRSWSDLSILNCPRFSASLIVCSNQSVFCFGGLESDPEDPAKFTCLKSIERLRYDKPKEEWETLKIKLNFKGSGIGAFILNSRSFMIFGGWNLKKIKSSSYIYWNEEDEFFIEEGKELVVGDSFIYNGLCLKNNSKQEITIFGTEYAHIYNIETEEFSIIGEVQTQSK